MAKKGLTSEPLPDDLPVLIDAALVKWIERGFLTAKAKVVVVEEPPEDAEWEGEWGELRVIDSTQDGCIRIAPVSTNIWITSLSWPDHAVDWPDYFESFLPSDIITAYKFGVEAGLISAVEALGSLVDNDGNLF